MLDLARHHLDLVDERIAQLTRFRRRLASEIDKWSARREATCTGLCEIIASASEDVSPPQTLRPTTRRPLGR